MDCLSREHCVPDTFQMGGNAQMGPTDSFPYEAMAGGFATLVGASNLDAVELRAILDSVPVGVGYWGRDLRNRFANTLYARWVNRTPEQILGISMSEIVGAELFERVRPRVEAALAGRAQVFEHEHREQGALAHHVNVSYVPYWREGRVEGFCVLLLDVSRRHDTDLALVQSEERYRALFEHMQTGFALHEVISDDEGTPVDYVYLACNPAYTAMTGLRQDAILGRRITEVLPAAKDTPADWIRLFGEVARTGNSIHVEGYLETIGKWYDLVAYRPGPNLFAVLLQDVTERHRIAQELAAQHERVRVTLHSIGDGVITTDEQGRVQYLNPVAERLTAWQAQEAAGHTLLEVLQIVDETTREPASNPIARCLIPDSVPDARTHGIKDHRVLLARDGREYSVEHTAAPILDAGGRVLGAVLVIRDITEQRELAREMSYRATHDALTQLANRAEFDQRLARELSAAHQSGLAHALLYIDLDQFKIVNDACGHAIGDLLLQQIGEILRECVRAGDTLARLGGDEFGVILSHCDSEAAQRIAQNICDRIDSFRFLHESQRLRVGASIGVVPLDRRWPTSAAVLQAADAACYSAKESGRNRVHAYSDPETGSQARQGQMRWATRLQQAIEEDRFTLYCQRVQPIQAPAGLEHYEILLRLRERDGEIVLPGVFMPAAERYQLASRVDRWVVRSALVWMQRNRQRLASVGTFAINLSGQSIGDRGFLRYVDELMHQTQAQGARLCFEITETAAISNLPDARRFFEAMRVHGCRFALDDFGSGLSSFAYLKSMPVDYLKIDGQFVCNAHNDALDRATLRCIQEVAHLLGKQTIAECAESPEVIELLRGLGVDFAQGYAVHYPEPIESLLRDPQPSCCGVVK